MSHTPGPWECSDRPNGPFWHISSVNSINGPCIGGRQAIASTPATCKKAAPKYAAMFKANALLISAAPDLLEALQFVMSAHGEQLDTAFAKAQDAILKATGGQP